MRQPIFLIYSHTRRCEFTTEKVSLTYIPRQRFYSCIILHYITVYFSLSLFSFSITSTKNEWVLLLLDYKVFYEKKKKKKNQSRETKFSNNSRSLRVSRQDSCSLKFNSIMDGRRDTNQAEGVDVVVQFYPWFKFYFLLFWGTVIYDSEFETEENIIWTKDKIEPQHRHWTHLRANSITNSMVSIDKQR